MFGNTRSAAFVPLASFSSTAVYSSAEHMVRLVSSAVGCVLALVSAGYCQDRVAEEGGLRGSRPAVSLTLKDSSGALIEAPATVRIYHSGVMSGQSTSSKGRAYFILGGLGDYTITVEASGYKPAQKEISLPVAVTDEEEIVLQRVSDPNVILDASVRPLLAPKAKEALEKGLQAIRDDKLDKAEKYLENAASLAPNHPDVLYAQGVLCLKRRQWARAQEVLEKATQIDPKDARAFSALGMTFVNAGNYDQAIAPLQQSLRLNSKEWETHWALAKAFYHHEQYDEALRESQEALAGSRGKAPEIELLLAQSLTAVGRYEEAAETLRAFVKKHPNDSGAATAQRWLEKLTTDGKISKN